MRSTIIFPLLLLLVSCSPMQKCFDNEFRKKVEGAELTVDLVELTAWLLNTTELGCPSISQGNAKECGMEVKEEADAFWTPGIPYPLLFGILYIPRQYNLCKGEFQTLQFQEMIKNLPEPKTETINWFEERKRFQTFIVPEMGDDGLNLEYNFDQLDETQRKLLPVFHIISSWNFCPRKEITNENIIVHAKFDSSSKEITIFNTACKAGKVYDAKIKNAIYCLRLFFITSHEFGHAIDYCGGTLVKGFNAEKKANLIGLVFSKAYLDLIDEMFKSIDRIVSVDKSLFKADDKKYFFCLWQRTKEMRPVLEKMVISPKTRKNKEDWNLLGCLEYK